jgi:hypothetical protein
MNLITLIALCGPLFLTDINWYRYAGNSTFSQ